VESITITSTVNPFDSIFNLNIYSKMPTENMVKSRGIGDILVDNVPLYNCLIYYSYLSQYSIHCELLSTIYISKPKVDLKNFDTIMRIPSLLGMDFLQRYNIYFKNNKHHLNQTDVNRLRNLLFPILVISFLYCCFI
jgi:hypothetical protein